MIQMENDVASRTCCGGVPLRNGRCPICGDIYESTTNAVETTEQGAGQLLSAGEIGRCPQWMEVLINKVRTETHP